MPRRIVRDGAGHPLRPGSRGVQMASGSGGRIVQPPVPMTITQIAVVVADMESALRSYTENLGWGPWSVFDYKPP
jgi:hypothetical protein